MLDVEEAPRVMSHKLTSFAGPKNTFKPCPK